MIKFCTLFSGSSGNSVFVGNDRAKLLIDAGVTAKSIANELRAVGEDPAAIDYIFITHEHIDHIRGAGVMARKFGVRICANRRTWRAMESELGQVDASQKIIWEDIQGNLSLGGLDIAPFSISHDAADPVGYTISDRRRRITVATDTGCVSPVVIDYFKGSAAVLIESNHDLDMLKYGPYPQYLKARIRSDHGHLSNDCCGDLATELALSGTKAILLGHLSTENNTPEVAYKTVRSSMENAGIKIVEEGDVVPPDFFNVNIDPDNTAPDPERSVCLMVAPRYSHSKVILL